MENPPAKLKTGRVLGQGTFSTVHKALYNSCVVAVKVLRPEYAPNKMAVRMLLREASLVSSLTHPHIIRYRAVCQVAVVAGPPSPALVIEYMESGSLADLLSKQMKQPRELLYDEVEGLTWMLQIADALSYLHRRDPAIIHRDVKPANVLLAPATAPSCGKTGGRGLGLGGSKAAGSRLVAKLCDFGLHQVVKLSEHRPLIRVSSMVAHASSSGIFHNPRVSEDGSLVLPASLLRTCERMRRPAVGSAAAAAAGGAYGTPVPGMDADGPMGQCPFRHLDSAVLSCDGDSMGNDVIRRLTAPLGLTSSMTFTCSMLLEAVPPPPPPPPLPPPPNRQPTVAKEGSQHASLGIGVLSVFPPGPTGDGGGGEAAAATAATATTAPLVNLSAPISSAGAATLVTAAAPPPITAAAHGAQEPGKMAPAAAVVAAVAGPPSPFMTAATADASLSPAPPMPPSPELRSELPSGMLQGGRTLEADPGTGCSTSVGGGGGVLGRVEGRARQPSRLQPGTPAECSSPSVQPGPACQSPLPAVRYSGGPMGRLQGWFERQLRTPAGAGPKHDYEPPPGGPLPTGSGSPFWRTSTAPRESGGGGRVAAAAVGGGGGRHVPIGQQRRSYSFGVSGSLGLGAAGAVGVAVPNAISANAGFETQMLERVFQFSGQCGSSIYMSPEVAQEQPYNEKADVFSFGVMLFEVMSRRLISQTQEGRDGHAFTRMMVQGRRPLLPPGLDPRVAGLIGACWHSDPLERPAMQQVITVLQEVLYGDHAPAAAATAAASSPRAAARIQSSTASVGVTGGGGACRDDLSGTIRHHSSVVAGGGAIGGGANGAVGDAQSLRTYDTPLSLELSNSLSRSKLQVRLMSILSTTIPTAANDVLSTSDGSNRPSPSGGGGGGGGSSRTATGGRRPDAQQPRKLLPPTQHRRPAPPLQLELPQGAFSRAPSSSLDVEGPFGPGYVDDERRSSAGPLEPSRQLSARGLDIAVATHGSVVSSSRSQAAGNDLGSGRARSDRQVAAAAILAAAAARVAAGGGGGGSAAVLAGARPADAAPEPENDGMRPGADGVDDDGLPSPASAVAATDGATASPLPPQGQPSPMTAVFPGMAAAPDSAAASITDVVTSYSPPQDGQARWPEPAVSRTPAAAPGSLRNQPSCCIIC